MLFIILSIFQNALFVKNILLNRLDKKGHQTTPFLDRNYLNYLITLATTPAPTVRPPSRIAKRKPSAIAIG